MNYIILKKEKRYYLVETQVSKERHSEDSENTSLVFVCLFLSAAPLKHISSANADFLFYILQF